MSESEGSQGPTRRSGRGIKIVLAASLALNLLIIGLVGGAILGRTNSEAPGFRALGLGPFAVALSRDDREDLRGRIEERSGRFEPDRRAIGQSLVGIQQALRAQPFDRAAAEAAFARAREAAVVLQTEGQEALLDQFEAMSVREREELADRLGRILRRFGPERHGLRED